MATVETRDIKKIFGDIVAVNGVNLLTRDGEFLVLLGPSGCGKSTLLRMIAGFEKPTEGQLLIGREVVNDLPPRARKIAMVFQSYALYPHMSVYKNIAFPLKAQRIGKSLIPQKVQWAAELFGIGHLLARRPRELSGGERQRVALARARASPLSFYWMSCFPISTRNSAPRQGTSFSSFSAASASRPST